jgi:hypothetical protein
MCKAAMFLTWLAYFLHYDKSSGKSVLIARYIASSIISRVKYLKHSFIYKNFTVCKKYSYSIFYEHTLYNANNFSFEIFLFVSKWGLTRHLLTSYITQLSHTSGYSWPKQLYISLNAWLILGFEYDLHKHSCTKNLLLYAYIVWSLS